MADWGRVAGIHLETFLEPSTGSGRVGGVHVETFMAPDEGKGRVAGVWIETWYEDDIDALLEWEDQGSQGLDFGSLQGLSADLSETGSGTEIYVTLDGNVSFDNSANPGTGPVVDTPQTLIIAFKIDLLPASEEQFYESILGSETLSLTADSDGTISFYRDAVLEASKKIPEGDITVFTFRATNASDGEVLFDGDLMESGLASIDFSTLTSTKFGKYNAGTPNTLTASIIMNGLWDEYLDDDKLFALEQVIEQHYPYYAVPVGGEVPWTGTGLWHVTNYRVLSHPGSWYFGEDESGSVNAGTPGDMGTSISDGTVTSPPLDWSGLDGSVHDVYLYFWQHLDIEDDTDIEIRIYLNAALTQTITKSEIVAAGTNAKIQLDNAVLGSSDFVYIEFFADTVVIPDPTKEGWFFDRVKILVYEA